VHCALFGTPLAAQWLGSAGVLDAALRPSELRTSVRPPWPKAPIPAARPERTCGSVTATATRFVSGSARCLPASTSTRADPSAVATAECCQGRCDSFCMSY
jgi:hypothetical protein